jgi:uncharacterized protein YktA (UPF0223 family)
MTFTKQKVISLRTEINAVLQGLQQFEPFYEIHAGKCSFDQDVATFKLEVKVKGAKSQSEKALDLYADHYGLDVSKIAKEQGKSFALIGYNYKASKYPFEMQDLATGKKYKTSLEHAQSLFAKAVQNA